jgi:ATP-dependent RNA helicase RhlE
MKFAELRLAEPILDAVATQGYSVATPIQAQTIPHVLEGRDVLGGAQTGTGKTAAFALPILQRLIQTPAPSASGSKRAGKQARCLVLCPTRELARQIGQSFADYGRNLSIRGTVIFGGVSQNPQVQALRRGVDIIVATPGRLQDLMNQRHIDLRNVETLVLDEADRMLDMGFINDIERIIEHLPNDRQTLLFSATMAREIRRFADRLLDHPVTINVSPETATVDTVDQSVCFVQKKNKPALLVHLLENTSISRALVFTRTKHGADRLTKQLRATRLDAEAIHGNKTQSARERALKNFTIGRTNVLVATDVAARGIDVQGISHVINYDLTHEPETYVHRIGRTARAGATGSAISFCDQDECSYLIAIQRLIHQKIAVRTDCSEYTVEERSMMMNSSRPTTGGNRPRRRPAKAGNKRNHRPAASHNKPTAKRGSAAPRRRRSTSATDRT